VDEIFFKNSKKHDIYHIISVFSPTYCILGHFTHYIPSIVSPGITDEGLWIKWPKMHHVGEKTEMIW
jgi:hypothetical protein